MRCPVKASDRMGKNVPHQIANAMPSRSRLLNRNALSRLTKDSSLFSVVRRSERHHMSATDAAMTNVRKERKTMPTFVEANAWTDSMIPLRVTNVPRIVSEKVRTISAMFHIRSIPRFS